MKKSLFLFILGLHFAFSSSAQGFSIDTNFYTPNSSSGFDFHFTGNAVFNDSLKVYYTVVTNDSIPQLLFSDSVDFTASTVVYPSSFSYNPADSTMQINLGTYPDKELILQLYSIQSGEIKESIFVNIHNLETVLEDEE
ncbi:MAG: hypothetical protein A3D31_01185 [Candidatus Fluviicola riflensis]|nr:MAG: hypothetical protein CHH17_04355 [Candidatus Fluviicola riflensis]OGS76220.1 MAG: hypothetical protein A3D31_01185 [Candidatus Fluviicola riflensis]OGS83236.1 MAG: hypothetical protein A2724_00655 [Fluviicola sp. RIFCSPHIGHO2_01_FULL_43_53]OGS83752.1 MAG: hypothetical protein A3E30_17790 [Fluviicola sp. RIFCSPHIGHO2_12_FULL_43_24]